MLAPNNSTESDKGSANDEDESQSNAKDETMGDIQRMMVDKEIILFNPKARRANLLYERAFNAEQDLGVNLEKGFRTEESKTTHSVNQSRSQRRRTYGASKQNSQFSQDSQIGGGTNLPVIQEREREGDEMLNQTANDQYFDMSK